MKLVITPFLFTFLFSFFLLTSSGNFDVHDGWVRYKVAQSFVTKVPPNFQEGGRYSSYNDIRLKGLTQFPNLHWGQVLGFIPLYALGSRVGPGVLEGGSLFSTFLNAFFAALLCLLFFHLLLLLNYSKKISLWMTFILAFSTMVWVYSKSMHDAIQETFFAVATFYFILKFQKFKLYRYLYISLLMMIFGFLTRYTFVLTLPVWVFLLFQTKIDFKKTFLYPACILIPVIVFLFSKLSIGWSSFSWWANAYLEAISFETFLNGLRGLLLSPGKSIFVFNPILLLSIFLFPSFYKKFKTEALTIIILSISYIVFYANIPFFSGDPAWGPRYLLIIVPFCLLPLSEAFLLTKKYIMSVGYCLIAIGVVFQMVGVCVGYIHYVHYTNYTYNLPRFFYHKPDAIYYYNNPKFNAVYQLGKEVPHIWKRMKIFKNIAMSNESLQILHARQSVIIDKNALKEILDKNMSDNVFDFWWLKAIYMNSAEKFKFRLVVFTFILGVFCLSAIALFKICLNRGCQY